MNDSSQPTDSGYEYGHWHSRLDRAEESMTVGWRFPRNLINEVKELARARGERPGVFVSRILAEQLVILSALISNAELEARMLRVLIGVGSTEKSVKGSSANRSRIVRRRFERESSGNEARPGLARS